MKALQVGMSVTRRIHIDTIRTIDFLGEGLRVYATPELVRDVELTCRDFLLGYTDSGEDSVGTGINISHSGATLLGMNADITVTVAAVEGRRITFSVLARDDAEEISRGEHSRFVVEVEKLRSRVAAKAAKASGE